MNTYRHAHFLDFLREIGGPGHHDDNTGREYQSLWLELGQLGSFPYCIISMKISWKHVRNIDKLLITNYWYVKSTQFKKLAANALLFTYKSLKSCKSHEKNETMNIRLSVLSFSSINLALLRFLFCFFMWFARFQILICEPQASCNELTLCSVKKHLSISRMPWHELYFL